MLLRPSTVVSYLSVVACASFVALICTVLYGTRTENPSLPTAVKGLLPAGRCVCDTSTTFQCDTCLECAANQPLTSAGPAEEGEHWVFDYRRDANNYGLREEQCTAAFPGLFEDISRARQHWKEVKKANVTAEDLYSFELTKGMVRAMIYGGELYVLETRMVDLINRQEAVATLAALHRALVAAPSRNDIPNVEFVFTVEDLPAQPTKPLWSLTRRAQDVDLWLIPDFGWWSWDMPQLGTFSEVADGVVEREKHERWEQKQDKLVWRGKITYAPKLRRAFVDAASGKPWGDVGQVKWDDPSFNDQFLGAVDQCGYKYIAHLEGRSYSGALKYRQLCRSVIVAHKLQWIQHFHYLLRSEGTEQNFVEVERDFTDLEKAMNDLFEHPEKAKRIADNSVKVFRERYLTPAAEACYWRALIKAWKEVSFEPKLYTDVESRDGHDRPKKRGVRYETFVIYEHERQMEYPKSAQVTAKQD